MRAQLRREPDQTLKALAEIGFKDAEGYSRISTLALVPKLKQFGIAVRSCQVEVPLITQNWDPFPEFKPMSLIEAIDGIAAAGIPYFTMSAIGPDTRGDGDDFYRRTADRMNAAGDLCRKSKIRFAWQMNAHDFDGQPGKRAIDIYKERLDVKLATMELDVQQAALARRDPAQLLADGKGHIPLVRATAKGPFGAGVEYIFIGQTPDVEDPIAGLRNALNATPN